MLEAKIFRPSLRPLLGATALMLAVSAGAASAAELHVEESAVLAAKPAAVWKLLGSFAGLPDWHPAVAATRIVKGGNNARGAVRSVETKDGARIVEELLAYDGKAHRMRYRIVDSPLPVRDYVSVLQVEPSGQGSRVTWRSDFDAAPDSGVEAAKARDIVAGIYQAGFDGLRSRLGE